MFSRYAHAHCNFAYRHTLTHTHCVSSSFWFNCVLCQHVLGFRWGCTRCIRAFIPVHCVLRFDIIPANIIRYVTSMQSEVRGWARRVMMPCPCLFLWGRRCARKCSPRLGVRWESVFLSSFGFGVNVCSRILKWYFRVTKMGIFVKKKTLYPCNLM